MKISRYVSAIFMACMLLSCATTTKYSVEHHKHDDPTNPFTTDTMYFYDAESLTYYKGVSSGQSCRIGLQKWIVKDLSFITIQVVLLAHDDLFITFGTGDILIKADDSLIRTVDRNPLKIPQIGGLVRVSLSADVTQKDLENMSNATGLRIEFMGRQQTIAVEGIAMIRRFCNEYATAIAEGSQHSPVSVPIAVGQTVKVPIAVGQTVKGEIKKDDQVETQYILSLKAHQIVTVQLSSSAFRTALVIAPRMGAPYSSEDGGTCQLTITSGDSDAVFAVRVVVVSRDLSGGAYTLSVRMADPGAKADQPAVNDRGD